MGSRALVSVAAVVALSAGSLGRVIVADEIVRLQQCPRAVQRTIASHVDGGTLVGIERTTDHGRPLYEVDVRKGDRVVEFDVEEDGRFVGFEEDGQERENGARGGHDEDDEHAGAGGEAEGDDGIEGEPALARDVHVLIPTPLHDRAHLSPIITHPYLPLSEVRRTEFRSGTEHIIMEVQDKTKVIAGVECLVLAENEYSDGELAEISYNYFAQDDAGNVYYFGEDVDEYEDGRVVSHGGSWLVGRNASEPCLFMPADLAVGTCYKPENSPPDASEWAMVASVEGEVETPAGDFDDVLVILESNHDDRWEERKYYARGVGLISENREVNVVAIGDHPAGQDADDDDEDEEHEHRGGRRPSREADNDEHSPHGGGM